jgi:hypothetical protein
LQFVCDLLQDFFHIRALVGPAGAFKQKGTVSLCMSLILIF